MKIRLDYVTNSSSSSYIIAMKDELSNKQKDVIIDFVKRRMLGRVTVSNKEELDKLFDDWYGEDFSKYSIEDLKNEELREKIKEDSWKFREYMKCLDAIDAGLSVKVGEVCFEGDDGEANLLTDLWEELEEASNDKTYRNIDISLDY